MASPDPAWRDLAARTFVPVEGSAVDVQPPPAPSTRRAAPELEVPIAAVEPADSWDARVSLFGDPEP